MRDLFAMAIHLDGESMNDFGRAVSRVCVEFPNVMLADATSLENLLKAEEMDRKALQAIVARVITNTQSAVTIGNGVATIIGMCPPVRIDGGPVQ